MDTAARPLSQKLPAGLAGMLNGPGENRDSAYFSSTDASSKHTSAASGLGMSLLNHGPGAYRGSPTDKTPSPTTASHLLPHPLVSPSTSNMSVASMVSPTTPAVGDMRRFERPLSLESAPNSAVLAVGEQEPVSRRESVDSRINQGFGDMRLGNSPYASHNQSTSSIHQTLLHQQRNPRPGLESLSSHRISNGYQPSADRNPDVHHKLVKTAPAITGPATSHIARAAEPTKGQAWAFPEEEIRRMPSGSSLIDSRRSSVTESIASTQYTQESSRLPPGQRRLEEGPLDHDLPRLSTASADYPTTHHHALQHRQLGDIQAEVANAAAGAQPYSRTPELRVSHKLAERKRRTEMKELFEQLRDLMPQERGSKASKWEILTKAISEHQRQQDNLRIMSQHCSAFQSEIDTLRREVQGLRVENQQLRSDISQISAGQNGGHTAPTQQSLADPYARAAPRPELPPLRALSGGLPNGNPESMTGVQYEQPRVNGYSRQSDRF